MHKTEDTDDRIALKLARSTGFTMHVDIALQPGLTVLFGPSGCGKTTVLRTAAGLERAAGVVRVAGQLWQDDARGVFVPTHARRLGYVFQEASLFAHLNVRQNLEYGLKRMADADGKKRLHEAVDLLGIGHLLDRRPEALSGGERQRCAIARSLAICPSALLMDEPLAALDHARRLEIMPWIERMKAELRLPIIYVTHSEEEVLRLADQLVVMDQGKVALAGAVAATWLSWLQRSQGKVTRTCLLMGTVVERDPHWGLMCVQAGGARFWTHDMGLNTGAAVRLMVGADNVSLSVQKPSMTSIQNVFAATVEAITDAEPWRKTVQINAGGTILLADLTARAVHELQLTVGAAVWAQVKSVSVH